MRGYKVNLGFLLNLHFSLIERCLYSNENVFDVLCILIEFPSLINGFEFLCMTVQIVAIEYPFTLIDLHMMSY